MKRVGKKKEKIRSKRRFKWRIKGRTPIKVYFEGKTVLVSNPVYELNFWVGE